MIAQRQKIIKYAEVGC